MATALSLSFSSLDPQNHNRFNIITTTKTTRGNFSFTPPLPLNKPPHFKLFSSSSSSSSQSQTLTDSFLKPGKFLTNTELTTLHHLSTYLYTHTLKSGTVWVRVMRDSEVDAIVCLLADSFAESMMFPKGYINLLRFLVKQYLVERRSLMPHMATLIAFYRGSGVNGDGEDEEMQLAGTVEISFNVYGANSTLPSPDPPKDKPYICNMAVDKYLRRRGIGWHLLKASEELISRMSSSGEVYLHCRMIDEAPFNMYTKADYRIVTTDSILVLLLLQRRKHLMCKKLPLINMPSETDVPFSNDYE